MEIEQKLAQSTIGLSPEVIGDNADSFQKVCSLPLLSLKPIHLGNGFSAKEQLLSEDKHFFRSISNRKLSATNALFLQVGSFSSGNTPDYDQIATSPQSIDGAISHFSVSPSSANSPSNPPFFRGLGQNRSTRSRTCSLASEPEESHSASPKDRMNSSQSLPVCLSSFLFSNVCL